MTREERITRLKELDLQISELQKEKEKLNPFANLRSMANKAFGEWSEDYIIENTKNIRKENDMGRDLVSDNLGKIEVKSTRNTTKITFNQIKPEYSDYHIFIIYDIDNIDTSIYLVPNHLFGTELTISKQHNYSGEGNCYTMSSSKKNMVVLEKYKVTWEELDGKA